MFTLAIVGRPNVGKSTLFNRLVGKRLALVDDTPGVTRDLREGVARLGPLKFVAIDTAGLEEATDESLQGRMRGLSLRAVDGADACLFVVDARAGITETDRAFAEILRRRAARVLLAANKAEGRAGEAGALDAWALGLGEPIELSAEHGEGLEDLFRALQPLVDAHDAAAVADVEIEPPEDPEAAPGAFVQPPDKPIQIAVMGRPNAGKSTLVNRLLGEDRLLTGPEAGITRDAISVEIRHKGQAFRVFDTAGMRKKARVTEKLEKLSVADALRAVKFAEVVILLMDPDAPFETQDLRLADLAEREGRAVVFAVSKWDLDHGQRRAALAERAQELLPQLKGAPLVTVSGRTGAGLDRLMDAVTETHRIWNARIATGPLNRWLSETTQRHPPPAPGGRRIRLRYMTQVKTRPPSFVAMCSRPEDLPDAYTRYLVNGLREDFGLPGVPLRLRLKRGDNPYEGKRTRRPTALDKHRR